MWQRYEAGETQTADTQARERYESDCLKLNSYTANMQLTQGKEQEKLQGKIERVQQTIGSNERDFKNFVSVLETTTQKWENEWKSFCDVGDRVVRVNNSTSRTWRRTVCRLQRTLHGRMRMQCPRSVLRTTQ